MVRLFGRFWGWVAHVVMVVGGVLGGGRNADPSAAKLYEQRREDYRP